MQIYHSFVLMLQHILNSVFLRIDSYLSTWFHEYLCANLGINFNNNAPKSEQHVKYDRETLPQE